MCIVRKIKSHNSFVTKYMAQRFLPSQSTNNVQVYPSQIRNKNHRNKSRNSIPVKPGIPHRNKSRNTHTRPSVSQSNPKRQATPPVTHFPAVNDFANLSLSPPPPQFVCLCPQRKHRLRRYLHLYWQQDRSSSIHQSHVKKKEKKKKKKKLVYISMLNRLKYGKVRALFLLC